MKFKLSICIVVAVTFFLVAGPSLAGEMKTAKVVGASDGDTLLLNMGARHTSVQLAGIDAPELGQPYGDEARDFLNHYRGKKVEVEILESTSKRGYVARVQVDGSDLSLTLVERGLAWPLENNQSSDLKAAAQSAKSSKEGLWSSGEPTPPWSYRETQGAPSGT